MNDKELLERAAKAAGYVVKGAGVDADDAFACLVINAGHGTRRFRWNPLTDDGDAFRLAVRLEVTVDSHGLFARVVMPYGPILALEQKGTDPLAATRRAIVRAAAALADSEPA